MPLKFYYIQANLHRRPPDPQCWGETESINEGTQKGPWLRDRMPSPRFIAHLILDKYRLGKRPCTPFKQFWNILKHSIHAEWITSSPHCIQLQSIRMREESWVGGITQKTAQPAFKIYPRKETSQQKSDFSFINKEIARTLGVFIWSKSRPGKMVEDQPRRGAQMWFRAKTPRNQASLERPWCYCGHTWPAPHGWELDLPDTLPNFCVFRYSEH